MLGRYLGYNSQGDTMFHPVGTMPIVRGQFDEFTGLDSSDLSADEIDLLRPDFYRNLARAATEPIFWKVHDMYHKNGQNNWLFPPDASNAVIYLVRNPFDIAISYSFHSGHQDYAETIRKMNDPNTSVSGDQNSQMRQIMGSWSSHFRSWTEQTDIPVLLVKYEDMLHDAARELGRVIDFCHIETENVGEEIRRAVEASHFRHLQQLEKEKGFPERPIRSSQFFRSGRAGEGKEKLSAALKHQLLEAHSDVMRSLGYLDQDQNIGRALK
jgi:aryl sulfotransferase